jgi:hypothetical protein
MPKERKIVESGKEESRKRAGTFETRSAPALTHVLPPIRPFGFPIYVARRPGGSIHSVAAATFTFYLRNPFPPFLRSCFPYLNLCKSAQSADPLDPVVRGWLRKS